MSDTGKFIEMQVELGKLKSEIARLQAEVTDMRRVQEYAKTRLADVLHVFSLTPDPPAAELVKHDLCPKCGHDLDTGWECNTCGYDASGMVDRRGRSILATDTAHAPTLPEGADHRDCAKRSPDPEARDVMHDDFFPYQAQEYNRYRLMLRDDPQGLYRIVEEVQALRQKATHPIRADTAPAFHDDAVSAVRLRKAHAAVEAVKSEKG